MRAGGSSSNLSPMIAPGFPATAAQLVIRFADASDADRLARLRYALRASTGRATEPETVFLKRCTAWMAAYLEEGSAWRCWVAEQEGQLIGAVWLQLVEKIPNPRAEAELHGYLTNFYVQPGARAKGIGSQLLQAVLEFCGTAGVHAVILWPTERSRTLYERHGFAVRRDIMELIIAEPPRP